MSFLQAGKASESMIENTQRPDYDWAGRTDIICLQCAIKRDDVLEAQQAEYRRKFIKTCKRLWTTRRVKKGLKVGQTRTMEWKEIRKEVDAEHSGLNYMEKRHIIMTRLQMLVANAARQIDSSGPMFKDLSCANRSTKHTNAQTREETCKKQHSCGSRSHRLGSKRPSALTKRMRMEAADPAHVTVPIGFPASSRDLSYVTSIVTGAQ
jgi:hypothetical protein